MSCQHPPCKWIKFIYLWKMNSIGSASVPSPRRSRGWFMSTLQLSRIVPGGEGTVPVQCSVGMEQMCDTEWALWRITWTQCTVEGNLSVCFALWGIVAPTLVGREYLNILGAPRQTKLTWCYTITINTPLHPFEWVTEGDQKDKHTNHKCNCAVHVCYILCRSNIILQVIKYVSPLEHM